VPSASGQQYSDNNVWNNVRANAAPPASIQANPLPTRRLLTGVGLQLGWLQASCAPGSRWRYRSVAMRRLLGYWSGFSPIGAGSAGASLIGALVL